MRLQVWVDGKLASGPAQARFYLADTGEQISLAWSGKDSLTLQGKGQAS